MTNRVKLGAVLGLVLNFAASLHGQDTISSAVAPDTLIALQRGACEKRCAVYRLTIFSDGTVIYEGRHFVRQSGLVKSGVSQETLAKLISDLEAGGFFQLGDNYGYGTTEGCDSIDSDRPAAILSVSSHGKAKTVLHHHRCIGLVPDKITELEDKVDRAVGAVKWIK